MNLKYCVALNSDVINLLKTEVHLNNIVTDLINTLAGNRSVNMFQRATTEAMFQ
jgi:hypothetical protein